MPKRYYVGAFDEITTILLDGTPVTVARGGVIEVSGDDAERFDLQPENWSTPDQPATKEGGHQEGGLGGAVHQGPVPAAQRISEDPN